MSFFRRGSTIVATHPCFLAGVGGTIRNEIAWPFASLQAAKQFPGSKAATDQGTSLFAFTWRIRHVRGEQDRQEGLILGYLHRSAK